MEKINSVAEFSYILNETKNIFTDLISNCVLMPSDIERFSAVGKLFAERVSAGVLFLVEERDFFRVYYYLSPRGEYKPLNFAKPLLVENTVKEKSRIKTDLITECLLKWGFVQKCENVRYSLKLTDEHSICETSFSVNDKNFTIDFANLDDCKDIYEIWEKSLDKNNSAIPTQDEFKEFINSKNIICVYNENRAVAVNKLIYERKKGSLWLVAVHPDYRRMGIATKLKRFNFSRVNNLGGNSCFLWVDKSNTSAIRADIKLGFKFDGITLNELIYK